MMTSNAGLTPASPIVSVKPVVLAAPGRGVDLRVKVSAPVSGGALPAVVLSHGHGSSLEGYGPLADFWAAHGFVVIQPTHLDSRTVGLSPDDPRTARLWRYRVEDLKRILDQLDLLEAAVPGLAGRVDRDRLAVAGHSFGGQSAGVLLGLRVLEPAREVLSDSRVLGPVGEDLSDSRVKAGVLIATAGKGGADLTPYAAEHFPFMNPDFTHLTAPALVVAGDKDDLPLTHRGPEWTTDPYHLSPGDKSLLTVFGGEHSLGGIAGYEVRETTDEDPDRVALIQHTTWAYLRHALGIESASWSAVRKELSATSNPRGMIESKQG
ncbi:alpha/beta hydrolase family protein [Kribbella sp. DT2]|uniref:alpha/beta hydrolase family protein n=1 Tax=Kribbella sp. DT2 TaxID=3393427 RepID=UPI003CED4E06